MKRSVLEDSEKLCNLRFVYLRSRSSYFQWVSMRAWHCRTGHFMVLRLLTALWMQSTPKSSIWLRFYYKATVAHKHKTKQRLSDQKQFFFDRKKCYTWKGSISKQIESYLKSIRKANSNVQGEKCKSKTKTKKAFEILCMFLNGYRKIRLEQGKRNWTMDRIRRKNSPLVKKVVCYQWDHKLRCHQKYTWKRLNLW